LHATILLLYFPANANQLKRWLGKRGCTFESHKGGSGHLTVRRNGRKSQLLMHGGRKELGTGLVRKILKDLGLGS
jgi:mRNA interferase HicA